METVLAAVVAASAGLVGVLVGARSQIKTVERQILLNQRASAYLRLSEFVVRFRASANTPASAAEDLSQLADTLDEDEWWALQGAVAAFGTAEIQKRFDELLTKRVQVRSALTHWNEVRRRATTTGMSRSTDDLDRLEARRREALDAAEGLLRVVSEELSD